MSHLGGFHFFHSTRYNTRFPRARTVSCVTEHPTTGVSRLNQGEQDARGTSSHGCDIVSTNLFATPDNAEVLPNRDRVTVPGSYVTLMFVVLGDGWIDCGEMGMVDPFPGGFSWSVLALKRQVLMTGNSLSTGVASICACGVGISCR